MDKKRTILMNAAVIAAVLLLAAAMLALSNMMPAHDITPNAPPPEESGVTITFEGLGE